MQLKTDIMATFENVTNIIEKQIPDQAKELSKNANNLETVAQYCEDIYVNSKEPDKQHILNETKGYTAQALASVAYQIHVLANSFLNLLDNQSSIIDEMNVTMSHLSHEVNIHKEKVARREIGSLTTNKCIARTPKVKRPEADEKPMKYVRKPIDYSLLDDIGHGVKLSRQSTGIDALNKIGVGRQNSYSSTHSSSGVTNNSTNSSGKAQDVPTPPLIIKSNPLNGLGTVRSNNSGTSSYYRPPVVPPSVPSEYLSRQELGIYSSKKELNQSAGAESLNGAYGYRRPSQSSNINASINAGNNANEYSGTDTLDKRMANTYLQQLNNFGPSTAPNMYLNNSVISNNNNNSVGYASGKEIGLIRTNLNNIDYASNGTMYRRSQLHSSLFERSLQNQANNMQSTHQTRVNSIVPNNNSSIISNNSSMNNALPPPPLLFAASTSNEAQFQHNLNDAPNMDNLENEVFGVDYLAGMEDEDGMIPEWVPIERCIEKVITTYDYEGLRDDELTFKENTYIYVIKKNDDHWYEGIMKNEHGQIIQGKKQLTLTQIEV